MSDTLLPDGKICLICDSPVRLVDDSGRGDGMQTPWFTYACPMCHWESGWAKTPDLADRVYERRVAPMLVCDDCGCAGAIERNDGHLICGQCLRDKEDCL